MLNKWRTGVLSGVIVAVGYLALGVTMILQPYRWEHTPSYANLIHIASLNVWGTLYVVAAVLFIAYLAGYKREWYAIIIHTFAFVLTIVWLTAFVVRYATDTGTTIANVVAWATYLVLIVKSALAIDEYREYIE